MGASKNYATHHLLLLYARVVFTAVGCVPLLPANLRRAKKAAKAEAASAALLSASAVRVEVPRDKAAMAGFRCSEELVVEELPPDGMALAAGVEVGMVLIGFGGECVNLARRGGHVDSHADRPVSAMAPVACRYSRRRAPGDQRGLPEVD